MKKLALTIILICFIFCDYSTVFAITNEISFSFGQHTLSIDDKYSGRETLSSSQKETSYRLGYTLYFDDLYDDNYIPLELVSFLQHSSWIGISGYFGGYDWESDEDNIDDTNEKNWTGFHLNGKSIFPFGLGLGFGIQVEQSEWDEVEKVCI